MLTPTEALTDSLTAYGRFAYHARMQAAALRRILDAADADPSLADALAQLDLRRFINPDRPGILRSAELRSRLGAEENAALRDETAAAIIRRRLESGRPPADTLICDCGCTINKHMRDFTADRKIPCWGPCGCEDITFTHPE